MTKTGPRIHPGLILPAVAGLLLSACGGGGGGGGGTTPPANSAPVASAGNDRAAVEFSTVQLSGSATDPNAGDVLTYAWTQVSGTTVALSNMNSAQASFVAPDTQPGTSLVLVFRLTVTDSGGLTSSDEVSITVLEPGSAVTLSGVASYEFVPANAACIGLNYNAIETRPIRRATVQVLEAGSDVLLDSTTTDDNGAYTLTVDAATNVFVRVRAELKQNGSPSWDVEVRDNTANTTEDLDLRPLYVLDTGAFDSGATDQVRNVTATTGWNSSSRSYTDIRAAAPFSVLDAIYEAMRLVLSAEPGAAFAPLDAYWSVNNSPTQGTGITEDDIASGDIGTSFYRSDLDALFLLGAADSDTEEFDDHVIVHEWGHYFEDVFSRSDSVGGSHGFGDRLDMRVAFGEGWATALAGMALDSTNYCDTQGNEQNNGFRIDIESDSPSPRGWFNEFSVMALIFDLWDDTIELGTGDNGSIGFEPIFRTMVDRQAVTAAHTSIFSFTEALRNESPAAAPFVDDLRAYHNINGTGIYGDGETNDGNVATPADALPVYTDVVPNGSTINICSNRENDSDAVGNKLSEHRFLRMTITLPSRYEFDIVTDAATVAQLPPDDPQDDRDQSDPDIWFYLNGNVQNRRVGNVDQGLSGEANRENFITPNTLQPGDYVMDIVEFRHQDEETDTDAFPARSCFDVTIQPAP